MNAEMERRVEDGRGGRLVAPDAGAGIRIYVVEDDTDLCDELVAGLLDFGFAARGFGDAMSLYRGLLQASCDIVVVDIGLPLEDGFAVAASLRSVGNIGIVFLTGLGTVEDRVRGLMEGGDAYLVKPVDMLELVASLLSVHRRMAAQRAVQPPAVVPAQAVAEGREWGLTSGGWVLLAPGGSSVALTASERSMMQCLFEHAGEVVSRETLVNALGHRIDYYLNHRLDMLVSRLRRKVSAEAGCALPLRAVRGHGFILSF